MSVNACPQCGEGLPQDAINLAEGVALCPGCGQLSRLSDVVDRKRPTLEILRQPPKGCSLFRRGRDLVVRSSLRSVKSACGLLFAAVFWNSIVSVFVSLAVAGLYTNLVGPLPAWFPIFDDPMPLGIALFLCVFLIPFVGVGIFLIASFVLSVAGRVDVVMGDNAGFVCTGVGSFGWRRRFAPSLVGRVSVEVTSRRSDEEFNQEVVIEADRTIRFGSMLQDDRREWVCAVLHVLLVSDDSAQRKDVLRMVSRATLYR